MVLPLILAAVGAITGVASIVQGAKASSNSRKAQKIQRDADNLRAAQERRRTIRDARIRQAAAQQNAENQGVGGSSSAYGGQGSITSQMNAGVSFIDDQQTAASISGSFMDKAAKNEAMSNMWGSFSNLAFMGAQMVPGKVPVASATAPAPSWQGQINNVIRPPNRMGPY